MTSLPSHLLPLPEARRQLGSRTVADHRRRRVLAAAVEVFAARGFAATGADDLRAAAHVGAAGFYARFGSKEDCFLAAYEQTAAAWRRRVAAALPVGAPWDERARAALAALLDLVAAEPAQARLLFVVAPTAGDAARARHERELVALVPLLSRGRELCPARPPSPALEAATVGGAAWLLGERITAAGSDGVADLVPALTEIVVEPYLAA